MIVILTSKALPARTEDGEVMLAEKKLLRTVTKTISVGFFGEMGLGRIQGAIMAYPRSAS